ncbi:hypothetical protein NHQ30_009148 [Ciborinia camelliae]|nr:hypothetical protein NHQ30_009148 [Ciborinia camelliae]
MARSQNSTMPKSLSSGYAAPILPLYSAFLSLSTEFLLAVVSMDCKVPIRKYVLIARPSKWAQKGDRVVVQSPVQNITNESAIPVRRFNGDDENSVCFMPVQDIEKDESNAYTGAMVTSKAIQIDTHGVALSKSESDSDFEYQPGDKFWLFIAAKRGGYENDVPVINLRTMATGSVPISHVCWFPKMRGPGNEVWTFGGSIRKLKRYGRNQFTFWTWGICQYLDGKPATTKDIQIPERNTSTDEQRWLSSADARPLFSEIYKMMTKDHELLSPMLPSPQLSLAERCRLLSRGLYTPPTSPSTDGLKLSDEAGSFAPTPMFNKPDMASWKSIVDLASKGTLRPPQSSLIHPQRTPSSPDRKKYRRTEFDIDTRSSSGCSHNDGLRKPILNQDGGAEVAKQLDRDMELPVLSAAHPLLRNNPTILSERYQIKKNTPTIEFLTSKRNYGAELCDRGKDDCEWSFRFTSKHYHPDHTKCLIAKDMPDHEHCVSAERALPWVAGPCLLNEGAREHECCIWKEEDMEDWPIPTKKEFDTEKIVEARKYHMASCDMSLQIEDESLQIKDESQKIMEEMPCPIVPDKVYNGPGKWLRDEIRKEIYFNDILRLGGMEEDHRHHAA